MNFGRDPKAGPAAFEALNSTLWAASLATEDGSPHGGAVVGLVGEFARDGRSNGGEAF